MAVMAPRGTIHPMTVSNAKMVFPYSVMISKGLRMDGVLVPARNVQNRMLHFAARHGIKPITQTFPMSVEGATEALKRLDEGKIRYRAVLLAKEAEDGKDLLARL